MRHCTRCSEGADALNATERSYKRPLSDANADEVLFVFQARPMLFEEVELGVRHSSNANKIQ